MGDEPAEEREVRRDPRDLRFGERVREAIERLHPCGAMRDELRDHRVVAEADLVALLDARVHTHDIARQPKALDAAGLRQERLRILGVQAHLDGVAIRSSGSPRVSPSAIRI